MGGRGGTASFCARNIQNILGKPPQPGASLRGRTIMNLIKSQKAFTLLEVMVAVTILSIIFGVVYTTFSTVSESGQRISSARDTAIRGRNLLHFLTQDIYCAFLPPDTNTSKSKADRLSYGFNSHLEDNLPLINFTAAVHQPGSIEKIQIHEIGYSLLPSKTKGYRLIKRVDNTPDNNLEEGGVQYELMDRVASLKFSFYKSESEWVETWEGSPLPQSIKIEAVLLNEELEETGFSTQLTLYQGREY